MVYLIFAKFQHAVYSSSDKYRRKKLAVRAAKPATNAPIKAVESMRRNVLSALKTKRETL